MQYCVKISILESILKNAVSYVLSECKQLRKKQTRIIILDQCSRS